MSGVSPEDLYRLVLVSSPSASSSGSRTLFVVTRLNQQANRYDSSVWLYDGSSYYPLTSGPGDTCPSWSPDEGLVAFVRAQRQEGAPPTFSLMVMRPGSEPYALFSWGFNIARPSWSPDSRYIAFLSRAPLEGQQEWKDYMKREALIIDRLPPFFNGEGLIFDRPRNLYVVDSRGGEPRRLTSHRLDVSDFAWSPDSRYIAYVRQQDEVKAYYDELRLLDLRTGEDKVLLSDISIASLAWSPDGLSVALLAHRLGRGLSSHYGLYIYDLGSGSLNKIDLGIDRNLLNGVNSEARGPSCPRPLQWVGDLIYFLVHDAGRTHLYSYTPGKGAMALLAPEDAVIDDFTVGGDGTIYYLQMDDAHPDELYVMRKGAGSRITGFNDQFVAERGLKRAKKMRARAKDGTELDYWVLEPYSGQPPYPWVLYIHGGPKTSYGYGFMFTFHALASAGIAVVYGNPRGSDGYSEEFADIRGRWGTVDYEDLMAIADSALEGLKGLLDPARGGVAGGSYGGFMTNWIITQTSRFRAAVTERSCVEWYSDWGTSDIGWYFDEDQLGAEKPWTATERYTRASPLTYIENVRTPLLIMHSLEDYRCPLSQALQLFTALKVLGVEVRMALFPGENHDLTRSGRPRSRVEYLKIMTDWLKGHLAQGR